MADLIQTPVPSRSQRVVLVACASRKQRAPAPARELYTSALFKASREFAERVGAAWYILSAKHGLVHPDTVIAPYNVTLAKLTRKQRERWFARVNRDLRETISLDRSDPVMILAGRRYREQLEVNLRNIGCEVAVPMEGLGIGRQLQWLNLQNGKPSVRVGRKKPTNAKV